MCAKRARLCKSLAWSPCAAQLHIRGLLKHVGCGANAAFMSLPAALRLRPVATGWLADESVLAPGSSGLRWHDKVCGRVPRSAESLPNRA